MTTTRSVNNPKAWAYIINSTPDILKNQSELKITEDCSKADVQEIFKAITSRKIQHKFCLSFAPYRFSSDFEDGVLSALKSGNCPVDFGLNISSNNIDKYNLRSLTNAISSGACPTGFILNLSYNSLHESLGDFSKALYNCPSKFQLILDGCYINNNDVLCLMKEVSSPRCRMQFLSLRGNNSITNDGGLVILSAIKNKGPSDLKIDLTNTAIDNKLLIEIDEQLEINRNLLRCTVIQKELHDKKSNISKLPQDLVNKVYQYLVPLKNGHEVQFFHKKLQSKVGSLQQDTNASGYCIIL